MPFAANRSVPEAAVIPTLAYADAPAAAAWLCDAFGFTERLRIADHRIQLSYQGSNLVVTDRGSPASSRPDHGVLVRVHDVDAHCAHARARGARVTSEPTTYPYGERQYSAEDLFGHRWVFSQTMRDADPAEWLTA